MRLDGSELLPDQLWSLLELAADGVWVWDIAEDQVAWSQTFLTALGYESAPPTRFDVMEITHPDDRERHEAAVADHLENGGPYSLEVRFRKSDGSYEWYLVRGLGQRDASGAPVRLFGYLLNIQSSKAAEEALVASERRFRSFMDNSPAAVYIKSEDSVHLYANEAAAGIVGVSVDEMVGKRTDQIFPPDTATALMENDRVVLEGNKLRQWTGEVTRQDGSRKYIHDVKFPISIDDHTRAVGGFGLDLTELRESQDQLEAVKRMESIGRLAGGIAHDYNNMLGVILGFSELALSSIGESHPAAKSLHGVIEAAQRSAKITKQLLGYARKQAIRPRRLNIAREVERELGLLDRLIGDNIEIELDVNEDAWRIRLDPSQLDQVLTNLCVNSRDAIGDRDGQIRIQLKNRVVEAGDADAAVQAPGDYVRMTFTDNGKGIPEEEQERLFEPFYTTKPGMEGSGLGLSTVYGIMMQNGGAIRVDSKPGEGATFLLDFPRDTQGVEGSTWKHSLELKEGQGRTLLLVEDEVRLLGVIEQMLSSLDYSVTAVDTVEGAREAFSEKRFDALVTDMMLGRDSGADLANELLEKDADLQVLFISGRAKPDTDTLPNGKAAHFVQKPFSRDTLGNAVAKLFSE